MKSGRSQEHRLRSGLARIKVHRTFCTSLLNMQVHKLGEFEVDEERGRHGPITHHKVNSREKNDSTGDRMPKNVV